MNGLILDKMAKIDEIQTRFNAGELSPNIDGIVDFEPFLMVDQ